MSLEDKEGLGFVSPDVYGPNTSGSSGGDDEVTRFLFLDGVSETDASLFLSLGLTFGGRASGEEGGVLMA